MRRLFFLRIFLFAVVAIALSARDSRAEVYQVGPGKPLQTIGAVPWESLQAGDKVLIHWRAEPYREKWVICRRGTKARPIVVSGVAGPRGLLPVIDGQNATTRPALRYWNQNRGVIKIGGASVPSDVTPAYITIENLDIKSARPPFNFTSSTGEAQAYASHASAIYIEKGAHLTIRNCVMRDCGNGFFAASGDEHVTSDLLVEKCYLYGNGIEGSIYEHNNYTAARGIVFQFNRFGPLRAGCPGNNLKDRSSGFVARTNWIEGGNRQLDLVEGNDSAQLQADPRYRESFVYGNVLIEPDGAGNPQIVHYGGDGEDKARYRKGTLFFFNNTIISRRADRTTLLRLSTDDEKCVFANNIAYTVAPGRELQVLDATGKVFLSHNWFKTGWAKSFGAAQTNVHDDGTSRSGESPGFVDLAKEVFRLKADSPCVNAGSALPKAATGHLIRRQYLKHRAGAVRPVVGALDVGAFEAVGNRLGLAIR